MRVTYDGCPGCGRFLTIVEHHEWPERPDPYVRIEGNVGVWGWCPTCQTPVEHMLKEKTA